MTDDSDATSGLDVLRRLFTAFAAGDGEAMAACYAPDARFSDPVYPWLRGSEVGDMWRMLTGRAKGLDVVVEALAADERSGSATWTASYEFGEDRRQVSNRVHSSFVLADGLVAEQRDDFDFHAWSAMALGPSGRLLGWTPWLRDRVRRTAAGQLAAFRASRGAAG